MPDANHTQPTANDKIIAELFPIYSENTEVATTELSQQQSQTLLHLALATITHFFGPPSRFFAGVDDPRDPSKITYPLHCLLFTGLLMFLCHLAARRQIALKFRDNPPSAVNFARLFGVEQAPLGAARRRLSWRAINRSPVARKQTSPARLTKAGARQTQVWLTRSGGPHSQAHPARRKRIRIESPPGRMRLFGHIQVKRTTRL